MKKKNSWLKRQIDELAGTPDFETERLLIRITEALVGRLIDLGLKKSDLARRMDVDRSIVTRALSGDQNMTIRSMVPIAAALGCRVRFEFEDLNLSKRAEATVWSSTKH